MSTATLQHPKIVSPEKWLAARKELLAKEKELTHLHDELNKRRRELPWQKVEKHYVFDGPNGKETLADLFDGRSQLAVYHFMFGPDWKEGCPSCSLAADHFDRSIVHLGQRDVTMIAVSRASLPQIEEFKKRMGWQFKWVSSLANDFNYDFHVSFKKDLPATEKYYNFATSNFPREEAPGLSVFYKDETGKIFHTYSTYGRGLEGLLGQYTILDLVPKGRDEDCMAPHPMAWVRHHDRYPERALTAAADAKRAQVGCCAEHS